MDSLQRKGLRFFEDGSWKYFQTPAPKLYAIPYKKFIATAKGFIIHEFDESDIRHSINSNEHLAIHILPHKSLITE